MSPAPLSELFIPALRYHLPRRSIAALHFPRVCKSVWSDLDANDRLTAVRDIHAHIKDVRQGEPFDYDADHWREFLRWAEERKT